MRLINKFISFIFVLLVFLLATKYVKAQFPGGTYFPDPPAGYHWADSHPGGGGIGRYLKENTDRDRNSTISRGTGGMTVRIRYYLDNNTGGTRYEIDSTDETVNTTGGSGYVHRPSYNCYGRPEIDGIRIYVDDEVNPFVTPLTSFQYPTDCYLDDTLVTANMYSDINGGGHAWWGFTIPAPYQFVRFEWRPLDAGSAAACVSEIEFNQEPRRMVYRCDDELVDDICGNRGGRCGTPDFTLDVLITDSPLSTDPACEVTQASSVTLENGTNTNLVSTAEVIQGTDNGANVLYVFEWFGNWVIKGTNFGPDLSSVLVTFDWIDTFGTRRTYSGYRQVHDEGAEDAIYIEQTTLPNLSIFATFPTINYRPSQDIDRLEYSLSGTTNITYTTPISSPYSEVGSYAYYRNTLNAVAPGSSTLTTRVFMDGAERCSATTSISVNDNTPWWQVQEADVWTSGDLLNAIPATTYFNLASTGHPGVNTYGYLNSTQYTTNIPSARLASDATKRWIPKSGSIYTNTSNQYNYDYFYRKLPDSVIAEFADGDSGAGSGVYSASSASTANLLTNSYQTGGVNYVRYTGSGDLTITGGNLITSKLVIFTDTGNVNITGNITFTTGQGLFMLISENSTTVGTGVTSLMGVYVNEDNFNTCPASGCTNIANRLTVTGSVTAWNGVNLVRDTQTYTNPSETFVYSPGIIFSIPFSQKKINWREVSP